MDTLNITEAKARFSELVERASRGQEVIVTRMGKPVIKISRYEKGSGQRRGVFTGQISLSDDFDIWPPEEADALGIS